MSGELKGRENRAVQSRGQRRHRERADQGEDERDGGDETVEGRYKLTCGPEAYPDG